MSGLTNTITKVFGTGDVYALVNNLTPTKMGVLQDIEIDIAAANVELYGQYQFPVASARGKGKITGKAKMGQFDVNLFNSLYYGGSLTVGTFEKEVANEAGTAGSSVTSMTPVISSVATTDLGLYYSANGVQLSYSSLSSALSAGQYAKGSSVAAPYIISSAEALNTGFLLNYSYAATTGDQLAVTNQLMGVNPVFELHLFAGFTDFNGRTLESIKLNRCVATKFNMPLKNSDFQVIDFEFEAFADSNGGLFTLGVGQ